MHRTEVRRLSYHDLLLQLQHLLEEVLLGFAIRRQPGRFDGWSDRCGKFIRIGGGMQGESPDL